jgi:hypothetical protein
VNVNCFSSSVLIGTNKNVTARSHTLCRRPCRKAPTEAACLAQQLQHSLLSFTMFNLFLCLGWTGGGHDKGPLSLHSLEVFQDGANLGKWLSLWSSPIFFLNILSWAVSEVSTWLLPTVTQSPGLGDNVSILRIFQVCLFQLYTRVRALGSSLSLSDPPLSQTWARTPFITWSSCAPPPIGNCEPFELPSINFNMEILGS